MAKTLIIKDANFSTNKVTTVTIGSVPCTDISLSESSFSITDYDPVEVEYTVTPSNTTDAVTWESSDENVATVENGVITPVGLGTATITATCGEHSDTATVSVAIVCVPDYERGRVSSQTLYLANASNDSRVIAFGSGEQKTEHGIPPMTGGYDGKYAIKLPRGTNSVTIGFTSTLRLYNGSNCFLYWLKDEPCGDSSQPNAAKLVSSEEEYNASNYAVKTFNVPEGADSMTVFFRIRQTTTETAETVVSDVGFSITFNTTTVS